MMAPDGFDTFETNFESLFADESVLVRPRMPAGSRIGRRVRIGPGVLLKTPCRYDIADRVEIGPYCVFNDDYGLRSVSIGREAVIGAYCVFVSGDGNDAINVPAGAVIPPGTVIRAAGRDKEGGGMPGGAAPPRDDAKKCRVMEQMIRYTQPDVVSRRFARYSGAFAGFGAGCRLDFGCRFSDRGRITLEENVYIGRYVWFDDLRVHIGRDTLIGPYVRFLAGGGGEGINIGRGSWVAAHVTLYGGAVIGCGSLIAAGAVIDGEIPPRMMVTGEGKQQRIRPLGQPANMEAAEEDCHAGACK